MDQRKTTAHQRKSIDFWLPRIVAALAVIGILGWCHHVRAHDGYAQFRTPDGTTSCCNSRDCHEVPYREAADGAIEFFVEGVWFRGQPHNLLPPHDDRAHACRQPGTYGVPRCLIPPVFGT